MLKKFLVVDDGLDFKNVKRGLMPLGGGEIMFKCPVKKNIKSIQFLQPGMVKRIRGIAYATKICPSMANRTVEAAKGVVLNYIPDVYIHRDQSKGKLSGNSSGFGVNLCAETTEGVFYSAEIISNTKEEVLDPSVPEDFGKDAALKLLEEIYRGDCVDSTFQWLAALFMALSQKIVSKFMTGPLSQYTIYFLQHLRDFFAVVFKLKNPDVEDETMPSGASKVLLTFVGIGYTNINKKVY